MAAARFQILAVLLKERASPTGGFTWRFLSANNRRLGQSAVVFADVESCRMAVRQLRERIGALPCTTLRDGPREWVWRIRLADVDLAVSSRSYQRRVEADHACASFVEHVGKMPLGRVIPQLLHGTASGFIRRSSDQPPHLVRPCDLRRAPISECVSKG